MAEPMRLFAYWRTSAGYRVRVALNLKGLTAEEKLIDLDAGEQLSPEFLAVNPEGAIPALIVEAGRPALTQSVAIVEYLDETHPEPPLLPRDPYGRARVRSLAALMTGDTHPLIVPRVRKYLTGAGFDADAWRAWQVQWFTRGLRTMEQRLAADADTGAFCHRETPGLADICLCSVTAVAEVFKIAVPDIPTVTRIVAACNALPAFARARPQDQVGAPA